MNEEIYKAAFLCKEFADKKIEKYRIVTKDQFGNTVQMDSGVRGDIKGYEKQLYCLRNVICDKYPLVEKQLCEEMEKYDEHQVLHQGCIEAIVEAIISFELQEKLKRENIQQAKGTLQENKRKIFVSHSSGDKIVITAFVKEILLRGCGFSEDEIFCTLDSTSIRTGDDFREQIIKNMRECDYILLFISENYNESEVCKNELGAAWAFDNKRTLPFVFPNISFQQMGFLNVIKQGALLTDRKKLDEFYDEICTKYSITPDWRKFNKCKEDFMELTANQITTE